MDTDTVTAMPITVTAVIIMDGTSAAATGGIIIETVGGEL